MRKYQKVLLFLTSILLCAPMVLHSCADYARPAKEIIRELVYTYYWHPNTSEKRLTNLFTELQKASPEEAEKWKQIISYWQFLDRDMELNFDGPSDNLSNGDDLCFIVLGFELNSDGTMKDELIGRLNTALACAQKYPNAWILCTGGGTAVSNKEVTEAGMMHDWLVEHDISDDRIIVENQSLTTTQNAQFSTDILRELYPEITSVVIVSSDYHIPWGSILFETQFIVSGGDITVVSNAAFPEPHPVKYAIRDYQLKGILEITNTRGWK